MSGQEQEVRCVLTAPGLAERKSNRFVWACRPVCARACVWVGRPLCVCVCRPVCVLGVQAHVCACVCVCVEGRMQTSVDVGVQAYVCVGVYRPVCGCGGVQACVCVCVGVCVPICLEATKPMHHNY